jgi:hypothetical protein
MRVTRTPRPVTGLDSGVATVQKLAERLTSVVVDGTGEPVSLRPRGAAGSDTGTPLTRSASLGVRGRAARQWREARGHKRRPLLAPA